MEAFRLHFERELKSFSRQLIVNLLDRKGDELRLSEAYESYLLKLNNRNIDYEAFDFHAFCKNDQFDNVNILLDIVADRLAAIG